MSSKTPKQPKQVRMCGTCQHYSWTVGEPRKTTCNQLGCIETTPQCPDYSVNPFVLQDFEAALAPLADVLRVMPITTISMFGEIVNQEKSLRRKGFYFLEKVAIKYWGTPGEQYVSNYIIARVYSATKEGVFVIAKSGIRMFVLKDSIMKLDQFMHFRKELKSAGKIVDPTISGRASAKQTLGVTENMDDVIARGMLEEDVLDKEIKRKLNPKRISNHIDTDTKVQKVQTSMRMSTGPAAKKIKVLDEAEEWLRKAEKGLLTKADRDPVKTAPAVPTPTNPPQKQVPKQRSPFDELKEKMRANKALKKKVTRGGSKK